MTSIKEFLADELLENNHHFSIEIQNKFLTYLNLMQQWNRVYNLTAIHNLKDAIMLHVLDSLSIHSYLMGDYILDVGTGAGLPGIPLALINPDKQFVLLDSNRKKTRFLMQVKYELGLNNVDIIHTRAEDFHSKKCFTTIVSRAFASIKVMLEATKHLICKEGQFLAMKGVYPSKEIADIPSEFKLQDVHKIIIKGLKADRCVLRIINLGASNG